MTVPEPAITLPCLVTEVIDGDTLTVEVRVPMRVRIKDCWAPEMNEKGGAESRDNLCRLAQDRYGVVYVPLEDVKRIDHAMSFGRVLGDVYIDGDDESLGQQQVSTGHAAARKPHK